MHARHPLLLEDYLASIRMTRAVWLGAAVLVAGLAAVVVALNLGSGALLPLTTVIAAPPVGDLPMMPEKPPASPEGFNGCPAQGDGGDADLNLLQNRVDKGAYQPVAIESILALTWPKSSEQRPMSNWTPAGRDFIAQYLGVPVVVEGYIDALREGVADAANCNRADPLNHLWRLSIIQEPRGRRSQAVIAISTPQTRMGHTWSAELIRNFLIEGRVLVRISGWLYFNPDSPQELGRTRATLWEITPVMQIEVFQDGRWNPLDKYGK
jgi:hypothetical protein